MAGGALQQARSSLLERGLVPWTVVEKLATMIRERFKFQARVRSMTTMNRSSALVLLVIPFVFIALMSVSNPEFVSPLWNTQQGQILGIVAASLSFGGYFVALRMASVEG